MGVPPSPRPRQPRASWRPEGTAGPLRPALDVQPRPGKPLSHCALPPKVLLKITFCACAPLYIVNILLFSRSVMSSSFATPWTVAHQVPLSMALHRQVEQVAIPFSRGSSQPRDQTCVSCTGRWILYHWATREVQTTIYIIIIIYYCIKIDTWSHIFYSS